MTYIRAQLVHIFLVSLSLIACSQVARAHEVSLPAAKKALYIPELQLYSRPLVVNGGTHLHIGSVTRLSKPGGGRYTCEPIPESQLNKVAGLIQSTLKRNKLTASLGLEYLILCGGVTANGQKIGGIPVPPLNLLMLSMVQQSDDRVAHLFWHEIVHYLEMKTGTYKDRTWESRFFGYSQKYELGAANLTELGSGSSGYVNLYGQSFPHEERAEIAAWLLSNPRKLTTFLSRAHDTMLDQKVDYMRRKMQDLGIE